MEKNTWRGGRTAGVIALTGSLLVAGTVFAATVVTPSVTVGNAAPIVSAVALNGGASMILTPNATTTVNVVATITDNNGCADINGGTTTVLLYRSGVTSSTCFTTPNNANCYVATAFTASSTCATTNINTTTTFNIYYFAQSTDASSSYPVQNWIATVIFKDPSNATGSADAPGQEMATLTALNVTTSSINYGTLAASSTTGAANQTTTITNVGNSSTTLNLSGTALSSGATSIATSSQHYATSSFTYGGSEQQLSQTPIGVPGFLLTAPTSTSAVSGTLYWGAGIPAGTPLGTYNGTSTFTAIFSS